MRGDAVDARLDRHSVPGAQLTRLMEREIRENDYVICVCTPKYKAKSDGRTGGVGYEGDIMTAEVFTQQNHEKFIPVLARGTRTEAAPSWLTGAVLLLYFMPRKRFELIPLSGPDPKSGASANFATSALGGHSLPQFSKMPIPQGPWTFSVRRSAFSVQRSAFSGAVRTSVTLVTV